MMTQGQLEKIGRELAAPISSMERRIMMDLIRRIKKNGFATATARWDIDRLQQLGESEEQIRKFIQEALNLSAEQIDTVFSDALYMEYMKMKPAYSLKGLKQIPFVENITLQSALEAAKQQLLGEYQNLTQSLGFAIRNVETGRIMQTPLLDFYRSTLDEAVTDIQMGAFSYDDVVERTINTMTSSGLRWIDYDSGHHNRVDVAARRASMTCFRQVQGKINEQTAKELDTDKYEVSVHLGARPSHQEWEGKVWTMDELHSVCGLGEVTGLHGANCYHDYSPYVEGASVRTYTDEQLKAIHQQENTPKTYNDKTYTQYEALQMQRKLETRMRMLRERAALGKEAGLDPEKITAWKAKYQATMQQYKAFSAQVGLPMQRDRITQDGLGNVFGGGKVKTK